MPEVYITQFYRKFEGSHSGIQGKFGSLSFLSLGQFRDLRDSEKALADAGKGGSPQLLPNALAAGKTGATDAAQGRSDPGRAAARLPGLSRKRLTLGRAEVNGYFGYDPI